jgi:serine protease inhibitor
MIRKSGTHAVIIALTIYLTIAHGHVWAEDASQASSLVVAANTRFALKFFHLLANRTSDQNVLVAPTGVSLTFALLDNGADAETRKEIEDTFEFSGISLPQLNQGFAELRKSLEPIPRPKLTSRPWWMTPEQWKKFPTAPPEGVIIADSIWFRQGVAFSASFTDTNRRYYGADFKPFLPTPTPSIQVSNWARRRTKRDISIEIPSTHADFIFVDVTSLHSFWGHEFDESLTKPDLFTLQSGKKKEVPFMHQSSKFWYFEGENYQAVVLPYQSGESMYIFLPSESSSLVEFEKSLTAENWQSWLSRFESRPGHVALPRFGLTSSIDLRAALKDLGVRKSFATLSAFSLMTPAGAMLTSARQSTSLKVDEQGTEATSVTIMAGVVGGVMVGQKPPPPFEMIVNRPFFFAITNNETRQMLFLGAVVQP